MTDTTENQLLRDKIATAIAQAWCHPDNSGKLDASLATAIIDNVCAALTHPAQAAEPFGYFRAMPFGWEQCAETDEGAIALYDRPQDAQSAEGGEAAKAWDDGYRAGVADERTSEANIGIAGFGMKVEPNRQNPYRTAPPASQEQAQQPMCKCGDRPASQCDEEWGPNCDLGNNPAHVKVAPVQQPSGGEVVWIQPNHLHKAKQAVHLCRVAPTQIAPDFVPLTIATPKPEPMTEHQRGNLVIEHLGPAALAGGQMSPLDAFTLGIEATERHHGITKEQA